MAELLHDDEWPILPASPPDLPKLEDRPTPLQLAQGYATLVVHHVSLWEKVVQCLEYLRGHLVAAKGDAARATVEATRAYLEVQKLREELKLAPPKPVPGIPGMKLPPPRGELPSSIDFVEGVAKKVSGSFKSIAKESTGPYVEASPERLESEVRKALVEELARRDAAKNAARILEIEEAERDRKKARRKLIRNTIAAFFIAAATAGGTWAWGKAQGKLEGHQAGVEEGKKAASSSGAAGSR